MCLLHSYQGFRNSFSMLLCSNMLELLQKKKLSSFGIILLQIFFFLTVFHLPSKTKKSKKVLAHLDKPNDLIYHSFVSKTRRKNINKPLLFAHTVALTWLASELLKE